MYIKSCKYVKPLRIFNHDFYYSAYADDTTFFVADIAFIRVINTMFNTYFKYSGLKPNISNCEIAGIGSFKGSKISVEGMRCVDLKKETIKIVGTHYSYDKALQENKNYTAVIESIHNTLRVWKFWNLTLEGKIILFKSLAISKITYQTLMSLVPKYLIEELENIQLDFLWDGNKPKIKHSTLSLDYKDGGLKSVNIKFRILSLQFSWFKKLYDKKKHDWKIIPNYLIKKDISENFILHSNLGINFKQLRHFPVFYQHIFEQWAKYIKNDIKTATVVQ